MCQLEENSRTIYYHTFEDDVVTSGNQEYVLPEGYLWLREKKTEKFAGKILYGLALKFAAVYGKCVLGVRFQNENVLENCAEAGFFLYGNHTQILGDVFMPAWLCNRYLHRGNQVYTLASPANLGIPVIGAMLPLMGALPIPNHLGELGKLNQAIKKRIQDKNGIVVYPEAHVWPYYTKIRPFPITSFRYPASLDVPSFCMTTTYQHKTIGKKPRITIYIDGPFFPEEGLKEKERARKLHDVIYECMKKRSKNSSYDFYKYEEAEK